MSARRGFSRLACRRGGVHEFGWLIMAHNMALGVEEISRPCIASPSGVIAGGISPPPAAHFAAGKSSRGINALLLMSCGVSPSLRKYRRATFPHHDNYKTSSRHCGTAIDNEISIFICKVSRRAIICSTVMLRHNGMASSISYNAYLL